MNKVDGQKLISNSHEGCMHAYPRAREQYSEDEEKICNTLTQSNA